MRNNYHSSFLIILLLVVIDCQADQAIRVVENVCVAGSEGEIVDVTRAAQTLPFLRDVEMQFAEVCSDGGGHVLDGFHFDFLSSFRHT